MAGPVFADKELIERGSKVFREVAGVGCQSCHGEFAEGDLGVGPFIRGATEGMIRAAIDATNEMIVVKNVITQEEIGAVAAYVNHLGSLQVARTLAKRGRFLPGAFSTRPGTRLQLIIRNSGTKPQSFKSDNMGIESITIPGRSTGSFVWQAPGEEGQFSLYCTDCKLTDQYFTIDVSNSAEEFHGTVPAQKVTSDTTM
ncbi:MAG: hypothetical protein ACE5OQ_07070 [Woeseia sp.]